MYRKERDEIVDGLRVAAPDLIIEVISPSEDEQRRDEKLDDYSALKVPEVGLISWEERCVDIRMLRSGKLETEKVLVDGPLKPSRFPENSIVLKEIWPEARG